MSAKLRRLIPGGRFCRSRSPADYEAWVAREPSVGRGHPSEWAFREESIRSGAQVVAVVHVFYPELLDELIEHLASIPVTFDLIVTNATGTDLSVDSERLPTARRSLVLDVENRGRDLWPLVQVINAGLLDGYELVVKVHTKRSEWREEHGQLGGPGSAWRRDLLVALLGDPENVTAIIEAFHDRCDLGIVTADGSVLGPEFWGQDRPVTASLLRRLDIDLRPDALVFPAGSMYWSRATILKRLGGLRMSRDDFEEEDGQIDGTTAHALERVLGVLSAEASLRIVERSRLRPSR